MLWQNMEKAMKHSYVIGQDFSCKPCPECKCYPFRVDYKFDVRKLKITTVFRGEKKTVDKERRTYYHCDCGRCTTDWCRPVRDENGVVIKESWQVAREAYEKGKFVKAKKIKIT